MTDVKNSDVIGSILRALYSVASRRTTQSFAATVIGAIIKTLEQNYEFLRYVHIENPEYGNTDVIINISNEIDTVDPSKLGQQLKRLSESCTWIL